MTHILEIKKNVENKFILSTLGTYLYFLLQNLNKAVYTAASVACGWAGAVW